MTSAATLEKVKPVLAVNSLTLWTGKRARRSQRKKPATPAYPAATSSAPTTEGSIVNPYMKVNSVRL